MDLTTFSKKNRERCESSDGFNHKLDDWSLSDWMTALTGEVGEAANIVKKLNRIRDGIPGNTESESNLLIMLGKELADTFIYLNLMFQRLNIDCEQVVKDVFNDKSNKIGSNIKV